MVNKSNYSKIFIKNLRVQCFIGVTEFERSERQELILNIAMFADTNMASKTDKIEDTINYKEIYMNIITLMENRKYNLLEKAADGIIALILRDERIQKVKICIEKPGALNLAESAGIEIERRR